MFSVRIHTRRHETTCCNFLQWWNKMLGQDLTSGGTSFEYWWQFKSRESYTIGTTYTFRESCLLQFKLVSASLKWVNFGHLDCTCANGNNIYANWCASPRLGSVLLPAVLVRFRTKGDLQVLCNVSILLDHQKMILFNFPRTRVKHYT